MKYYFDNFDNLYDELIEEPFIKNSMKLDKIEHLKKGIKKNGEMEISSAGEQLIK